MSAKSIERGTVKYFNFTKKFGFIIPESGEDDIFVHYSDISGEYPNKRLYKGDLVEFATVDDERGKKKAIEVKKIGGSNERETGGYDAQEGQPYEPQGNFVDDVDCHQLLDKLSVTEKNSDTSSFITLKFKRFKCCSLATSETYSGIIEVMYEPSDRLIDLSSLQSYLRAFSATKCEYDKAIEVIYNDLLTITKPVALEVTGHFTLENAIETTITLGNTSACG